MGDCSGTEKDAAVKEAAERIAALEATTRRALAAMTPAKRAQVVSGEANEDARKALQKVAGELDAEEARTLVRKEKDATEPYGVKPKHQVASEAQEAEVARQAAVIERLEAKVVNPMLNEMYGAVIGAGGDGKAFQAAAREMSPAEIERVHALGLHTLFSRGAAATQSVLPQSVPVPHSVVPGGDAPYAASSETGQFQLGGVIR